MTDQAPPDTAPSLELADGLPPLVADRSQLDDAALALADGSGPIAVDTERASGYRYYQRAYLVQIRRRGSGTLLIDPIAVPDLGSLWQAAGSEEWVIHAASQDLPALRELGLEPQTIFDTELAGRLLNLPRVGLGPMVEAVLGLHMAKEHSAADWSTRPLPDDWLHYAALDVEVLVELRDLLRDRLQAAGKLSWALQEFAAVLAAPLPEPRPDQWRRVSGSHKVPGRRGLAIVRSLWEERERLAQRRDIAPRRVLPDQAIVSVATSPPASAKELRKVRGFAGRSNSRHAERWFAAIERGRTTAESDLPQRHRKPSGPPHPRNWPDRNPAAAERFTSAREVLTDIAESNDLPLENLLQPAIVRAVAWQPPDVISAESVSTALAEAGARPWQVELSAAALAQAWEASDPA